MKRRHLCAMSITVLAGLLGGCAGDSAVRHNLTPELMTMTKRPVDVANARSLTWNENWRMFYTDFNRGAMLDHPSTLSRLPSPY